MSIFSGVDILVLSVLLLCAFDALREVSPFAHPVRAVAFALVTAGSFGWIAYDLDGLTIWWWAVSLHAGLAIFAVILVRTKHLHRSKCHVDDSGRPVRRTDQRACRRMG